MADQKISELTALTGANLADVDAFAVVDTSAVQTKKITYAELKTALDTGTGFVRITGDTMTGNLSFGDDNKIILGGGSDLEIYHDGNDSIIRDVGEGDLILRASSSVKLQSASGVVEFLSTNSGTGALTLASTNFTGSIDVTGTVTADGLTVDGSLDVNHNVITQSANSPRIDLIEGDTTNVNTRFWQTSGDLRIYTLSDDTTTYSERIRLDHATGDISFYEDTGTTAKFFWDASAESLGINATPTQKLHVGGNAIITGLTRLGNGTESSPSYQFVDDTNTGMYRSSSDVLGFSTGGTNRLTLNSTGATFAGDGLFDSGTAKITVKSFQPKLILDDDSAAGAGSDKLIIQSVAAQAVGDYEFVINNDQTSSADQTAIKISGNGDISFYEDTGTTAKFFWDSSAESLGIGEIPQTDLNTAYDHLQIGKPVNIMGSDTNGGLWLNSGAFFNSAGNWEHLLSSETVSSLTMTNSIPFRFRYAAAGTAGNTFSWSEAARIDSSGNLGIGVIPTHKLHVNGTVKVTGLQTFDVDSGGGSYIAVSHAGNESWTWDARSGSGSDDYLDVGISGGTRAMSWHETGNVGIGTSSGVRKLEIAGNNNGGAKANYIRITDTDTSATAGNQQGGIEFYTSDGGNENVTASIENLYAGSGAGSELTFNTAPNGSSGVSEGFRLDENGNLLVGKTADDFGTVGTAISQLGEIQTTRASATPLYVRRNTGQGELIGFYKDNTPVGSIGVSSNQMYIGYSDTGIRFTATADDIRPWNPSTGVIRDGAIDLGDSAGRFKDLYLSGGVVFGATGGSVTGKTLDDYEEGTFTATLSSGATTTPTTDGTYTKIGNRVYISLNAFFNSITVNGTALQITGLPFTNNGEGADAFASCSQRVNFDSSKIQYWNLQNGTTTLNLKQATSNTNSVSNVLSEASGTYTPTFGNINFHYTT